jgi:hypothetical protein
MQTSPNRLAHRCETGWKLFTAWQKTIDNTDTTPYYKKVRAKKSYLAHVQGCSECTPIAEPETFGA